MEFVDYNKSFQLNKLEDGVDDNNNKSTWLICSSNFNVQQTQPSSTMMVLLNASTVITQQQQSSNVFESKIIVPLYLVIFLLSVIGNFSVLITLSRNKRMRTVTNVYLLNLVSKK